MLSLTTFLPALGFGVAVFAVVYLTGSLVSRADDRDEQRQRVSR